MALCALTWSLDSIHFTTQGYCSRNSPQSLLLHYVSLLAFKHAVLLPYKIEKKIEHYSWLRVKSHQLPSIYLSPFLSKILEWLLSSLADSLSPFLNPFPPPNPWCLQHIHQKPPYPTSSGRFLVLPWPDLSAAHHAVHHSSSGICLFWCSGHLLSELSSCLFCSLYSPFLYVRCPRAHAQSVCPFTNDLLHVQLPYLCLYPRPLSWTAGSCIQQLTWQSPTLPPSTSLFDVHTLRVQAGLLMFP